MKNLFLGFILCGLFSACAAGRLTRRLSSSYASQKTGIEQEFTILRAYTDSLIRQDEELLKQIQDLNIQNTQLSRYRKRLTKSNQLKVENLDSQNYIAAAFKKLEQDTQALKTKAHSIIVKSNLLKEEYERLRVERKRLQNTLSRLRNISLKGNDLLKQFIQNLEASLQGLFEERYLSTQLNFMIQQCIFMHKQFALIALPASKIRL